MNSQPEAKPDGINSLLEIMQCLRDPERGCPWDLKQDFDSIAPYTLEETYELVDAIASGDYQQIKDELGDVLFQVVFYSQIGSERQLFDFDDVVAAISQKLVRRHPHVFDNPHGDSIAEREVKDRWEQIKSDQRIRVAISGANAAVVGVLLAAFATLSIETVNSIYWGLGVAIAFVLIEYVKVPAWVLVLATAAIAFGQTLIS